MLRDALVGGLLALAVTEDADKKKKLIEILREIAGAYDETYRHILSIERHELEMMKKIKELEMQLLQEKIHKNDLKFRLADISKITKIIEILSSD